MRLLLALTANAVSIHTTTCMHEPRIDINYMRARHAPERGSPGGLWSGWERTYLPFQTRESGHQLHIWEDHGEKRLATILSKALTAKNY